MSKSLESIAPLVQIVHCVDTEGPLYESLGRTFDRINGTFGLDLVASKELLILLQNEAVQLGGIEAELAHMFRPELLALNDDWDALHTSQKELFSQRFRNKHRDSFGNDWLINWFCCDHVGYTTNPSRREIGVNKIHDFYVDALEKNSVNDTIEFHFHPAPHTKSSISNAVHWFSTSTKLFEILASRVIDRQWFPSSHRPGFHTIRPDSHWFLEQFIPFDYANQATDTHDEQPDLADGRFGDWRRAPKSWMPYHPAHDDHQIFGNCRRSIFRCLNVGTRFRCLTQHDVDSAFAQALEGGSSVLAFTDHDFRNQIPNITSTYAMIQEAARKFPDVQWKNASARSAAQAALALDASQDFKLKVSLTGNRLDVTSNAPTFGPQPFLALKSINGTFIHDSFDILIPFKHWSYTFDEHSLPLAQLAAYGVASNSSCGQTDVVTLEYTRKV